jgi:acetyl esterase/lipase
MAAAGRFSSALLLLLNMAAALFAPRGGLPPAPASVRGDGANDDGDVDFFFFPFLVLYNSGRVQRFMGTDTVPASTDAATGVASRDAVVDAAAGLAVRLYLPRLATNRTAAGTAETDDDCELLPLVVFFHGGAFVTESAFSPTYHRYLNALASRARVLAVSVAYRLAPEHRLPAAYDDAWAALRWTLANARSGPDPWLSRHVDLTRLFLAGDSAGGNIAHNMAMRAGREGGLDGGGGGATAIRGLALLDPYFWGKRPVPSETRDGDTRRWRERTWDFVCAGRYGIDDPVINPVAMPPKEWRRLAGARVLVTVAGLDALAARGRAYVHALRASGWRGEAELYETPGENHVYFLNKPDDEKAAKEMDVVVDFINGDRGSSTYLRMDHGCLNNLLV